MLSELWLLAQNAFKPRLPTGPFQPAPFLNKSNHVKRSMRVEPVMLLVCDCDRLLSRIAKAYEGSSHLLRYGIRSSNELWALECFFLFAAACCFKNTNVKPAVWLCTGRSSANLTPARLLSHLRANSARMTQ